MRVEDAPFVRDALKSAGFNFVTSLPATQMHHLQELIASDPDFIHVPVSNEGEGVAMCAGAWMTGKTPLMLMESTGILLATYALLRCHATFGLPTLLLSTYRGDLGEQEWYAVHTGSALPQLLQTLKIPSRVVSDIDELGPVLLEARRSMDVSLHPVSVLLAGRLTRSGAPLALSTGV